MARPKRNDLDPAVRDALRCTTLSEALLIVATDVWDNVTIRALDEDGGSASMRETLRREWLPMFQLLLEHWTAGTDMRSAVSTVRRLQRWIEAYRVDAVSDLAIGSNGETISFVDTESGARYEIPWLKFWNDIALGLTARGLEWEAERVVEQIPVDSSQIRIALDDVEVNNWEKIVAEKEKTELGLKDKVAIVKDFAHRAKTWAVHHALETKTAYMRGVDDTGVVVVSGNTEAPKSIIIPWQQFFGPLPQVAAGAIDQSLAADPADISEPEKDKGAADMNKGKGGGVTRRSKATESSAPASEPTAGASAASAPTPPATATAPPATDDQDF